MEDDIYLRYLRKYYKKYGTINDIRYDAIVKFEDVQLQIGRFLNNMRALHKNFLLGKNINGSISLFSQYRYEVLDSMEFIWNPRKEKVKEDDIYIRYLRWHYEKYGTINNIKKPLVVDFENKKVKIGSFLNSIRAMHKNFLLGIDTQGSFSPTSIYRYEFLDSMEFIWEPSKEESLEDDIYIRYLRWHYEKYGSINNIEYNAVVRFEGQELRIGIFLSSIGLKHKNFLLDKDSHGSLSQTSLYRYRALDEMNFDWNATSLSAIAKENKIAISTLLAFRKDFNDNTDKALKFALLNKKNRTVKRTKEDSYTLMIISEKFGIDIERLIEFLNKDSLRMENATLEVVYHEDMSLQDFCTSNGYHYDIILYAVKLKDKGLSDEDFESLINRSVIEYKLRKPKRISNWVYFKYGNEIALKQLLSSIGFNPYRVLYNMSKNVVTLEQAIEEESFKIVTDKTDYDYLRDVYGEFVTFYRNIYSSDEYTPDFVSEALCDYNQWLTDEYCLTEDERNIINSCFEKYRKAVRHYQLFDVGFEEDNEKKIQKIIDYRFSDADIEEAFFMPLEFEKGTMVGRNVELFQRRSLIRTLADSWTNLSSDEKIKSITQYGLNEEELGHISRNHRQKTYGNPFYVWNKVDRNI